MKHQYDIYTVYIHDTPHNSTGNKTVTLVPLCVIHHVIYMTVTQRDNILIGDLLGIWRSNAQYTYYKRRC